MSRKMMILACLILAGCSPSCFQFNANRDFPAIDMDFA